uniref:Uncharacterized protein n=1 Tax=Aegilops tauschii subsp. strangulata TaxID=200361 RepID=A0A453JC12_AEGTS
INTHLPNSVPKLSDEGRSQKTLVVLTPTQLSLLPKSEPQGILGRSYSGSIECRPRRGRSVWRRPPTSTRRVLTPRTLQAQRETSVVPIRPAVRSSRRSAPAAWCLGAPMAR